MQILIKENPVVSGGSSSAHEFRKKLQGFAGKWMTVETEHLFGDQFNTVEGLRIMISHVSDIKDDIREMAAKCGYCGLCIHDFPNERLLTDCPACYYKANEGIISYDHELAVMDRIRPLLTKKEGNQIIIHTRRRKIKVKTPEGEVTVYGDPMPLRKEKQNVFKKK